MYCKKSHDSLSCNRTKKNKLALTFKESTATRIIGLPLTEINGFGREYPEVKKRVPAPAIGTTTFSLGLSQINARGRDLAMAAIIFSSVTSCGPSTRITYAPD